MAESTESGGIGQYLKYAPLAFPPIGIPVLIGYVAYKAGGLAIDAAGFGFGIVKNVAGVGFDVVKNVAGTGFDLVKNVAGFGFDLVKKVLPGGGAPAATTVTPIPVQTK